MPRSRKKKNSNSSRKRNRYITRLRLYNPLLVGKRGGTALRFSFYPLTPILFIVHKWISTRFCGVNQVQKKQCLSHCKPFLKQVDMGKSENYHNSTCRPSIEGESGRTVGKPFFHHAVSYHPIPPLGKENMDPGKPPGQEP